MTKQELEAKVLKLEEEIERLKGQLRMENHYHYHQFYPQPYQLPQIQPDITSPTYHCGTPDLGGAIGTIKRARQI